MDDVARHRADSGRPALDSSDSAMGSRFGRTLPTAVRSVTVVVLVVAFARDTAMITVWNVVVLALLGLTVLVDAVPVAREARGDHADDRVELQVLRTEVDASEERIERLELQADLSRATDWQIELVPPRDGDGIVDPTRVAESRAVAERLGITGAIGPNDR